MELAKLHYDNIHINVWRKALILLDDAYENKLSGNANPLWQLTWARRESPKASALWTYALRQIKRTVATKARYNGVVDPLKRIWFSRPHSRFHQLLQ